MALAEVARTAAEDARLLEDTGFTALMIENFHDVPFRTGRVEPETVAAMAVVCKEVREAVRLPVGVNVLRNDGISALGVAAAAGGSFVRVNVLAGAAVTDQGLVQGEAWELMRRRAALGVSIEVLADVDVKHASALDSRPVPDRARDLVERAGADAVLVTGSATSHPTDLETLSAVADAVAPTPVLAASGTHADNVAETVARCAGAIVGTAIKHPETGRIDSSRAARYIQALRI